MWELTEHYVAGISYTNAAASSTSKSSSLNELSDWQELVIFCTCKPQIPAENETPADAQYRSRASISEADALISTQQPRVLLVEPVSLQEYALLNEDIIEVNKAHEKPAMCHQCHLAGVPDENSYFILTPHDMIQIYPCTADDHVEWLIDNQLFRKALEFAKIHAKQMIKQSVYTVGRHYLDFLIGGKGNFAEAAKLCPEVCGRRKDVWEEYTSQFERHNQLKYLAPFLPVHDPQLEPECYQSVLLDFLKDDFINFKNLVFKWSPDLYRTGALINDILRRLYNNQDVGSENHVLLLSTLAVLYTHERSYERALEIYLKLRDRNIFSLIDNYHLFSMVKNRIQELMIIDTDLAVRLLLENSDKLPAATIMTQLNRQPKLQLAYLDKLFARGEGN
uniref:Uncharacterized protein n=1 Tax=Romanomermis culicivorax TaxID=13658 RepID=A0A915JDG6_ROMCU